MKIQPVLIALTAVNVVLLVFTQASMRQSVAQGAQGGAAPVIRGRALEIVDERGRVRASIKVQPAGTMPSGQAYPETVLLRLIDPEGRPTVKVGSSKQGAGLGLLGATDTTQILLEAEGANTLLKLTNADGQQQVVRP